MSATERALDLDLDSVEQGAQARVEELRVRQQELALPALTDGPAAEELTSVQDELSEAQRALEQVGLARLQREHLERQALEEAARASRDRAMSAARKLRPKREAAARQVDQAADAYAAALSVFAALSGEQEAQLRLAGCRAVKPAGSAFTATLVRAFFDHKTPPGMLELPGVNPKRASLVESDPRQPLE